MRIQTDGQTRSVAPVGMLYRYSLPRCVLINNKKQYFNKVKTTFIENKRTFWLFSIPKGKSNPITGLDGPRGFQQVKAP
jgi:hypothetical protein